MKDDEFAEAAMLSLVAGQVDNCPTLRGISRIKCSVVKAWLLFHLFIDIASARVKVKSGKEVPFEVPI